jgi:hypothetical protein
MSKSDTRNVKLGVCSVTFGGVDLGYTKGGVEVTIATTTHEVMVDQFGNTPIDDVIIGRTCKAKVPLAETGIATLARIMPGAVLKQSGGAYATGTITLATAQPTDGDTVTVNGAVFTFKTAPVAFNDVAIGASLNTAAANLAQKINDSVDSAVSEVTATAALGVVTLTADDYGAIYNSFTLAKTFATSANCTLSGATLTGGVDPTVEGVSVPTGVGISLLQIAKELVLHPQGLPASNRNEDFIMPLSNTPGAATFSYKLDAERVFNLEFNAYPDSTQGTSGRLFYYGNPSADPTLP